MSIVGFTGVMGAGKTTAANMIEGAIVLSFAEPLKSAVKILFALTDTQLHTLDGKNTVDPRWGISPRELLQYLGTDCIRNKFPGHWVKLMGHKIQQLQDKIGDEAIIAIDDIRFEDEAELVRSLNGTVVHVIGRKVTVGENLAGHKSESGIRFTEGDTVIDNSGTIPELKKKIWRLTEYEKDIPCMSEEDVEFYISFLKERNFD